MSGQVVCEVCGLLVDKNKYERHKKYGHKENKDNRCSLCGKTFTSSYNLQYHMAHHINARSFLCNECPKTYNTAADLAQHQRIHDIGREPFKCEECGMFFEARNKFNVHMKTHKTVAKQPPVLRKTEPKECPICEKSFMCLAKHNQIVHMKQRNYDCDFCDKKFGKKSGLDRHVMTVHKKEKNHKTVTKHPPVPRKAEPKECPICEKSFMCLAKHNKIVHMKQRNYDCDFCDKNFGKKSGLDRHVMTVHKKEKNYKCEECGKTFGEKAQLKKHERLHLFTYCAKCKDHFEDIKLHNEEKHSNLKHSCNCCFKVFERLRDLECHMKTMHSTIRSYYCDYCDKGFAEKFQIERHMKVHIRQFIKELRIKEEEEFSPNEMDDRFSPELDLKKEIQELVLDVPKETFSQYISSVQALNQRYKTSVVIIKEEVDDENFFKDEFVSINPFAACTADVKEESDNFEYTDFMPNYVDDHSDDSIMFDNFKNHKRTKSCGKSKIEFKDNHPLKKQIGKEPGNKYICDICGKEFSYKFSAQKHMDSIHKKIKYECKICNKSFSFRNTLQTHIKVIHQDIQQHQCQFCQKKFGVKCDLTRHLDSAHFVKKFFCDLCGSQFSHKFTARKHMDSIHKKIKHECEICHKTFTFKNTLYTHIKVVHQDKRQHECQFCNKKFGVKYALTKHIEIVHSENPSDRKRYVCDLCGKTYTSSSGLYSHKKTSHDNVKKQPKHVSHPCNICHESFKYKHYKLVHSIQVHLNGKRLKRTCGYCKTDFDLYEEFKAHIESHVGLFICMICDKFYYDEQSLNSHKDSHKSVDIKYRNYVCDHCDERLLTKLQLKVHLRKHTSNFKLHYCDYCGKGFKFVSSLYTHRTYHEEGRFPCTYCGRKFARNTDLVIHVRSHTNEKPFKCEICSRGFSTKNLLKCHQQTHPGTSAFKCRQCRQMFVTKAQLTAHENQLHPEIRPHFCFICDMSFKYEHNLTKHNSHKHS